MTAESEKSFYYQEIARNFFSRRGGPYVLSSQDYALISGWEEMGIPLRVVLEGIERSFEMRRRGPSSRSKVRSLSFCSGQVLRAFEQHSQRRVGGGRQADSKGDKKEKAKASIQEFLKGLPQETSDLKGIFEQALKLLESNHLQEGELERLEEKTEETLFRCASPGDQEEVRIHIRTEFNPKEKAEFERLFRIKMVKFLREKFRIPHLSLFYY